MNLFFKISRKLHTAYRRYILRDSFLLEVSRWFRDKGDETLRLDYPLTQHSIVFDLGGYHGDFAQAIHEKYGCSVYIFEPVPEFYNMCVERFKDNPRIKCYKFGLSGKNERLAIALDENATSAFKSASSNKVEVEIKAINDFISELNIEHIDLMKVNIEGGEFDLITSLIASKNISKIVYLQVQFHNFVKDAVNLRNHIRTDLGGTHEEQWNYEFVWESWKRK